MRPVDLEGPGRGDDEPATLDLTPDISQWSGGERRACEGLDHDVAVAVSNDDEGLGEATLSLGLGAICNRCRIAKDSIGTLTLEVAEDPSA